MEEIHYRGFTCFRRYSDCTYDAPTNEILPGPTKTIVEIRKRTLEEFCNENADNIRTAGIAAGIGLVCLGLAYLGTKIYQKYNQPKSVIQNKDPSPDKLGESSQDKRTSVEKLRSSLLVTVYNPSVETRRLFAARGKISFS